MKTDTTASEYERQANDFLAKFGIRFRATLKDSKPAPWDNAGHHFRVTLSRNEKNHPARFQMPVNNFPKSMRPMDIVFDFWGCKADAKKGIKSVTPYTVLSCISGDVHCSEYGYGNDSIIALQTFRRANAFAKRLRAFFTPLELTALAEIS